VFSGAHGKHTSRENTHFICQLVISVDTHINDTTLKYTLRAFFSYLSFAPLPLPTSLSISLPHIPRDTTVKCVNPSRQQMRCVVHDRVWVFHDILLVSCLRWATGTAGVARISTMYAHLVFATVCEVMVWTNVFIMEIVCRACQLSGLRALAPSLPLNPCVRFRKGGWARFGLHRRQRQSEASPSLRNP